MDPIVANGFQLVYQSGGKETSRDFSQPHVFIGRSDVCDVVIGGDSISRKHAEIVRDGEGWTLRDLRSSNGTTVGGERVVSRRLRGGDQIVLAATTPERVAITFLLPETPAKVAKQVLLYDDPRQTRALATIDLEELERSLRPAPAGRAPAWQGANPSGATTANDRGSPDSRAPVKLSGPSDQLPVIRLFKQLGEILLTSESLDEMLQKVIALAIDNLPGQRGVICLYDENSGAIEPKAFCSKAGEGEPKFLVSRSILHEAIRVRQAMLVANAANDPRFRAAASVCQIGVRAAICVPLLHAGRIKGLIYVDSQRAADEFDAKDLEILSVLGLMTAGGVTQLALHADVARKRAMLDRLSRYNSPRVVEQILSRSEELEGTMHAGEYEVSVLFADLTGFTSIAEGMSAAEAVQLLNAVFERLAAAVFQNDGTLDKYIGDALMAVFGAPVRQEDHAMRAVNTALLMRQSLQDLNGSRGAGPALKMRYGINSGRVIAGDIGSSLRKEYTVIGDAVNVACRLEAAVAQPDEIVIGPATFEQVKELFQCESIAEVQLKGKRQSIRPYRVLGPKSGSAETSPGQRSDDS
ncbi:MAG: adenylate/guanylate cyclase domain-containing protein [Thermoguttaceae bacterium]